MKKSDLEIKKIKEMKDCDVQIAEINEELRHMMHFKELIKHCNSTEEIDAIKQQFYQVQIDINEDFFRTIKSNMEAH